MIFEPPYMVNLTMDKAAHVYRYNGVWTPNITLIVPSDYSHVPPQILERARVRGQRAHLATEEYDLGTIDWTRIQPDIMPRLEAWIKFKNDYEVEFEPEDVERRLYHPLDCYAGTGDRPRAWIKPPNQPRRLSTIEIKTIAQMDKKDDDLGSVNLQTAGQARAENYRARALGIPECEDRWGVQLRKDGTYLAAQYRNKHAERIFLAYLTVIKHQVLTGKIQFAANGRVR